MAKTKTVKKETTVVEQTPKQLQELLVVKQADLLGYRKGLAIGELKNSSVIRITRKEIARIKTELSSKEGEK